MTLDVGGVGGGAHPARLLGGLDAPVGVLVRLGDLLDRVDAELVGVETELFDRLGLVHRPDVDVVVRAEVGVDHLLVAGDLGCRPLGDQPALGHHEHPVADLVDHVHVVLDEQHGAALGLELVDVVEQALLERRVDAGHRLVEHDQLRVGHQRPGHLQQLALTAGEVAGELVAHVVEAEALRAARRRAR